MKHIRMPQVILTENRHTYKPGIQNVMLYWREGRSYRCFVLDEGFRYDDNPRPTNMIGAEMKYSDCPPIVLRLHVNDRQQHQTLWIAKFDNQVRQYWRAGRVAVE